MGGGAHYDQPGVWTAPREVNSVPTESRNLERRKIRKIIDHFVFVKYGTRTVAGVCTPCVHVIITNPMKMNFFRGNCNPVESLISFVKYCFGYKTAPPITQSAEATHGHRAYV